MNNTSIQTIRETRSHSRLRFRPFALSAFATLLLLTGFPAFYHATKTADGFSLADAVEAAVEAQLRTLPRADIARASWRDFGAIILLLARTIASR